MTGTVGAMTVMQREACCAQGNVAFCATTTKAPVIIHDKPLGVFQVFHLSHFRTSPAALKHLPMRYYTNVRTGL